MSGLVAMLLVRRWHLDLMAPHIQPATVAGEVERHPKLAGWLRARTDPSVATGSLLTATVALIVVGAGGVGVLLAMVRAHRGFADFDMSAARWGAHHATTTSTHVLRLLTQFGGAAVMVPLAAVVGLVQWWLRRRPAVMLFLTLVVGGQFLIANVIKALVDRTRPDIDRLTGFSGPSFPSGHATTAAACFAALALVAGLGRTGRVRSVLAGLAVGLAVMIATSRVLLGVHWLTDVLAGLCLGWAWFAICSIAFGGRLLRFGATVEVAERVAEQLREPASSA
jgi:undecaprenyl-diphosphatase